MARSFAVSARRHAAGSSGLLLLSVLLVAGGHLAGCRARTISATGQRTITLAGQKVVVELAATSELRALGLMNRKPGDMPENHGMLFIFPEPDEQSFWMKNCFMPIDIAYIANDPDGAFRITNVYTMQPEVGPKLDTEYQRYPSTERVAYVLELNGGWFEKHGVKAGDRLDLKAATKGVYVKR
ncbi:MAG: DUF192 domain-containing protein [Planctomycetota bacterium]